MTLIRTMRIHAISVINVQNVDVFEANDSQYDTNVSMVISMGSLPDIMVVSSQDEVEQLVEAGLIEDLTESYNNCISDRIMKAMAIHLRIWLHMMER